MQLDRPAMNEAEGGHRLTIQPGAWQLWVPAGQSVLQAALAAGVRLPSSCRNGSCRSCLARLLSGRIHYRIEWPGLLAEEKVEGWILPCVACADSDLVIEALAASKGLEG
jgi:ferredoxin